jgi:hypothetical protein
MKIIFVALLFLFLFSCSWFASDDDPDVAYKDAKTSRPLELPPELVIDTEDEPLE